MLIRFPLETKANRCNEEMQKRDTSILDFYNTATEIRGAFDPAPIRIRGSGY